MKILHNPRCGKSRQTLNILKESQVEVEIIEYLKDIPTKEELQDIINKLGIKPFDLVRKDEAIYKSEFKGKELSDEAWIEAMITYPKLIERPIVIKENQAIIGRPPENVLELIS